MNNDNSSDKQKNNTNNDNSSDKQKNNNNNDNSSNISIIPHILNKNNKKNNMNNPLCSPHHFTHIFHT